MHWQCSAGCRVSLYTVHCALCSVGATQSAHFVNDKSFNWENLSLSKQKFSQDLFKTKLTWREVKGIAGRSILVYPGHTGPANRLLTLTYFLPLASTMPLRQPQEYSNGLTQDSQLTTHNYQLTTHNSQLTTLSLQLKTHNSQLIIHNSQFIFTTHTSQLKTLNSQLKTLNTQLKTCN